MTTSSDIPSSEMARRGRSRLAIALVAGLALLAAAGLAVYLWHPWHESGSQAPGRTTTHADTTPAPSSVTVPGGLAKRGVNADGVDDDGWLSREASLSLAGGGPAVLVVHGD